MPQPGVGISRSGGRYASAPRMRAATVSGSPAWDRDDAEDHGLAAEAVARSMAGRATGRASSGRARNRGSSS
jgi:hypothetical protein